MRKFAEILIFLGGLLLVFSATITFKLELPKEIDQIIYYRGILLGSILIIVGSAIIVKSFFIQNALISLGSGNLALIIVSSLNLLFDDFIDLDFYFTFTMYIVIITMILLTIIRLWLSKLLTFLGL
jgi:hypothetical protein